VNDNPLVQAAVLGVLALIVGFLLLTRMSGGSGSSSPTSSTTEASVTPTAAAPSAPAPSTTPDATAPTSTVPAPAATAAAPSATGAAPTAAFVAGPGLPAPVVKAYAGGKVVVVLIVRRHGIDDAAVKASVQQHSNGGDVALFVTNAGHISRYARIAEGVNVDRVPALIVMKPRNQVQGVPVATVSYGFRSADSVAQAIQNSLYKGPTNLPSYPK
jgi:hypothetical protein